MSSKNNCNANKALDIPCLEMCTFDMNILCAESNLEHLDNVCRVCLCHNSNLISIREIQSVNKIKEKIEMFSGVKIISPDTLPSWICEVCAEEMTLCYKFIEKCIQADFKLQKLLEYKHSKTPFKIFEEESKPEIFSKNAEALSSDFNDSNHGHDSNDVEILLTDHKKPEKPAKNHSDRKKRREGQHMCEMCGKGFSSSSNLRTHQRLHSGERPYRCAHPQCGSAFAQRGALAAHERRHAGLRPFACAQCPAAFAERTHLRRHASVHSAARPFQCAACGKALKSAFALKQHAALHAARRDHVCERCGAAFSVKGNLGAHVRARHGERSGQCPACGRAVADLREHMALHSGERPHACPQCPRRFARRRGLQVHARQHAAPAPLPCPRAGCARSFRARWVLDCHLLKHSGATPFVCHICSKGFIRVCHLTKHLKLNHLQAIEQ